MMAMAEHLIFQQDAVKAMLLNKSGYFIGAEVRAFHAQDVVAIMQVEIDAALWKVVMQD